MSSAPDDTPDADQATTYVAGCDGPNRQIVDTLTAFQRSSPPTVTIHCPERALSSSEAAAQLQPQLPPYELSFWTDASLPFSQLTPKSRSALKPLHKLAGFCVVHRRWDMDTLRPGDPYWTSTWWLSGFVAPNINSVWQAESMSVVQALRMAVEHCEQISGVAITTKRYRPCKKRIAGPMPTVINIFSDNSKVLLSLGGLTDPDPFPRDKWLYVTVTDLITILRKYGVRVNFQWVPAGHSSDKLNGWAHEGARVALNRHSYPARVYRKQIHRVMLVPHRKRGGPQVTKVTLVGAKTEMQDTVDLDEKQP